MMKEKLVSWRGVFFTNAYVLIYLLFYCSNTIYYDLQLGPEGLFDEEGFEGFLTKELPPSLYEKGGALFRNCKETTGSHGSLDTPTPTLHILLFGN